MAAQRLHGARRRLLAATRLLLIVLLAGCSGSSNSAAAAPTAAPTSAGVGVTVPVQIFKETPGQALAIVQVTLQDGKSYPFAIDTGASATIVSRHLAQTIGLRTAGQTKISGVNDAAAAPIAVVQMWSIRGVALPATRAAVANLPRNASGYVGLLGGDVLATFGAIRLDYRRGQLTLEDATRRVG